MELPGADSAADGSRSVVLQYLKSDRYCIWNRGGAFQNEGLKTANSRKNVLQERTKAKE